MPEDVSISVSGVSHPVLCGRCKQPIAFIGEPDADSGENVANGQEVARTAVDYAKDEGQLIVNRAMRDAARGSKIMSFNGQTAHDKHHRFSVDLKL